MANRQLHTKRLYHNLQVPFCVLDLLALLCLSTFILYQTQAEYSSAKITYNYV